MALCGAWCAWRQHLPAGVRTLITSDHRDGPSANSKCCWNQALRGWDAAPQPGTSIGRSQEPALDVMAPSLAQHLLNTAVGLERKCWEMKEIVVVIKNVMSNKAMANS